MSTTIDYKQTDLRTISAVESINVYDARTGAYVTKEVTRFTDSAYGTGTAQDIKLHAYQYTANGKVQTVSMSQLFMTICMNRANDLEAETVEIMDEMSKNTTKINELADIEDIYLNDTKIDPKYIVWTDMDFSCCGTTTTFSLYTFAKEVGLTIPSFLTNESDTYLTITAEEYEQYKQLFADVVSENRTRLDHEPEEGSAMGYYFQLQMLTCLYDMEGKHYIESISDLFEFLFGDDDSAYTSSYWYINTGNLKNVSEGGKLTAYNYQVGDKYFQTREEVYAYAKSEYGIDMSKDQSTVTSAIESKLDEYNSISQEQMIELQSLVSKRDQAYTLISNALKSMYNSNLSAANNF